MANFPVPNIPIRAAKAMRDWQELNQWATQQSNTTKEIIVSLGGLARGLNLIMNHTSPAATGLPPHAASHLPGGSDSLATAIPGAILPDDVAAIGTAFAFARSDHRHAITADIPSAIGSAAAEGTASSFARSDHVHIYPVALRATSNGSTLTSTDTATVHTLTSSLATLDIVGATAVRFGSTTNTVDLGAAARRIKTVYVGTSFNGGPSAVLTMAGTGAHSMQGTLDVQNLNVNGTVIFVTGIGADLVPSTAGFNMGGGPPGWGSLWIRDTSAALDVQTVFTSSPALGTNRVLTINMANGSRTLTLTGNLSGDQDVSSTASPTFVSPVVTTDIRPDSSGGADIGADGLGFATAWFKDASAAFEAKLAFNSATAALTADRTLTVGLANGSRTLTLAGNLVVPSGSAYTPTNVTTDRAYDANATSVDELADVLGTLIADLQAAGVIT